MSISEEMVPNSVPKFKKKKDLINKGRVNLTQKQKSQLMEEVRARRPASIFENKSSVNRRRRKAQNFHKNKPKEAFFDLEVIKSFANDHKQPDFLREHAKLQL